MTGANSAVHASLEKSSRNLRHHSVCAPCNNADGAKQLMVGFIFLSTLHHIIDPFIVDLQGDELEVPEFNVMFCVPFNQTSSIKERGKEEKLEENILQ